MLLHAQAAVNNPCLFHHCTPFTMKCLHRSLAHQTSMSRIPLCLLVLAGIACSRLPCHAYSNPNVMIRNDEHDSCSLLSERFYRSMMMMIKVNFFLCVVNEFKDSPSYSPAQMADPTHSGEYRRMLTCRNVDLLKLSAAKLEIPGVNRKACKGANALAQQLMPVFLSTWRRKQLHG